MAKKSRRRARAPRAVATHMQKIDRELTLQRAEPVSFEVVSLS